MTSVKRVLWAANTILGGNPVYTAPADLVVRIGEEIPAPELKGWRLAELWKDRATFTNALGDRTELEIRAAR